MTDKEDLEELPVKYTKAGFKWGVPWRKKPRVSVGTKLSSDAIEAWKVIARERGEHLNKVLTDLIMAEFDRLSKNNG